ncbi:uncharacterized protein M421DRAFT_69634, partial [Didymella exigua CBS 183.55]
QLTTLRKHFKVTDQQRRLELAAKYSDIQKKPKNQSTQAWLDEYSQITSQCAQESMPEMTETQAQWQFIHAVRDLGDEAWAQAQFLAMEQGESNALLPTPTLQDLISQYQQTVPTAQNATQPLGSFTSLSITEPKPNNHPKKDRSTGRFKDFEPSTKALSKLVVSFQNKDTLKKVKKAYKDAGIRWTFDLEKAKAEIAKRKNSASRHAHQADTASDCSSDGYASNTACLKQPLQLLQSNTALSLHAQSLQHRWVMDPGSDVHICNKAGSNWKQIKLPSSQDTVQAGCNSY